LEVDNSQEPCEEVDVMSLNDKNIHRLAKYRLNTPHPYEHKRETMALLTKLLAAKSMTQAQLAKELKRDKTTVNRWCKDSREVAWDNALKIAEVLKCHPVEIYQPSAARICSRYIDGNFDVRNFPKDELESYSIPFEYNTASIFLLLFDIPGSHLDGEIGIFEDIRKGKKFSRDAINKFCYLTPSKKLLALKPTIKPKCGVLQTNNDGTFKMVSPFTRKPLSEDCTSFPADHIDIASPIIAKQNLTLKATLLANLGKK
tara:strand:+ start:585 stop:1358 length:774 start_codon:yes stop_codon:yes gene_type:complete